VSTPIVIAVDAMGGDHGPSAIVPGVARAAQRLEGGNVRFLLCGDAERISTQLARSKKLSALCEIRHSDLVIASDEKPAQAMRRGKGSSMWNAIEAVKTGDATAVVSSGNTGALMAMSKLILRMAADLERPAIVASWPSVRGSTTVLDVGANVGCSAEMLVDFAIMGEAFHRAVHGVKKPTVGLLNIGSEEQKGHEELREAHRLLREGGLPIAYYGFVEGDDISASTVDVVITDGFTGNVALKTAEGTARYLASEMRLAFTSSLASKIGAMVAQKALKKLKHRLDPNTVNGGPLLGLNGIVVKSHGGANDEGFANAIMVAAHLAQSRFADEIRDNMQQLMTVLAHPTSAGETP